jgi:transposase-like protein
MTIRASAKEVGIDPSTAFSWRHKLLATFDKMQMPKMKNVHELIERKVPYSAKGQKTKTQAKHADVSIIYVTDRKNVSIGSAKLAAEKFTNKILENIKHNSSSEQLYIHEDKVIFTKSFSNINIEHQKCKSTRKNILAKLSRAETNFSIWESWLKRFYGVATKYINNYLHWFNFLINNMNKELHDETLINLILKVKSDYKSAIILEGNI